MRALPEELRRPYDVRVRPTVDEMIANDPTEAVRAEEVLPFVERHFEVLERKRLGGAVLQHLLYEIVQNFRFEVPRERSLIEMLCTVEAMLTDSGRIPCDFVICAARKKGSRAKRVDRPLPPRAEAARDVEPDPLRRLPRITRMGGGALTPHQRRLLRLALLSQQPRRANLFEEDARLGPFARANAWEWLLAHAPHDAAVRGLLEAAAILDRA